MIDATERQAAAERRDAKRDLRRRLPEAARPLVTLADQLDGLAAEVRDGRNSRPRWEIAAALADRAAELRRQLDALAAEVRK